MKVSTELQDVITEVFNIGVGRAAASLSEMLGLLIEMDAPEIMFMTRPTFEEYARARQGKYVCIEQSIHGEMEGVGTLSFPLDKGKTLVDTIMNVSSSNLEFSAVETEAIQEVGNIIINSVGASFDNVIGLDLIYDVPEVAFLDTPTPIKKQSAAKDNFYMMATTSIKTVDFDIEGTLNLMFAYADLETVEKIVKHQNE
ncbi:MAG: chemotaxis protein CheC [SAR324 cluster bacterium]|nr:chemotaxis protein CheC [SAR324 cluster bacterium]